jgi:hypothetical protein
MNTQHRRCVSNGPNQPVESDRADVAAPHGESVESSGERDGEGDPEEDCSKRVGDLMDASVAGHQPPPQLKNHHHLERNEDRHRPAVCGEIGMRIGRSCTPNERLSETGQQIESKPRKRAMAADADQTVESKKLRRGA